jgi:putative ABC transport system permease protein
MLKRAEWRESLSIALYTMRSQKMRTFLTMLGVVIGVASVISVAAIIDGLNFYIKGKVQEIGSKTFFLTRFPAFTADFDRLPEHIRTRKQFKPEDSDAIRALCPSVDKTSPILTRFTILGGSNEVRYMNNRVEEPILRGALPELLDVLPVYQVREGRIHTSDEERRAEQVCLLGDPIAKNLFGPVDPLGKEIRLNGLPFRVIGIFEPHQGLFGGPGVDDFVIIPYRTFEKLYPEIEEVIIAVTARDAESMLRAEDEVVELMRRRRNVPSNAANDFELTSPDVLTDLWDDLTSAIVILTLIIASIGLIVGGIGVMNIMLINVTERTQEIGIRKAVGARRKDIGAQFLLESVAMTSVGGVIGVLVGVAFSFSVTAVFPDLLTSISAFWTVLGLLMASAVGLFFGIYPAVKAANLEPVRCLRYE